MMSVFFFKQKTAYEMRISDWSSDVCSSDLIAAMVLGGGEVQCIRRLQAESRTQMGTVGEHHRRHRQLNKLRQPLFVISLQLQIAIAQRCDQAFELHQRRDRETIGRLGGQSALNTFAMRRMPFDDRKSVVEGKSVSVQVDPGGGEK